MKKYILAVFLGLFVPLAGFSLKASVAKADDYKPTIFGFGNGNFVNENGEIQFICFMAGDCWKPDGTLADFRIVSRLSEDINKTTQNKVNELNNKIDALQNTINQLQQPISGQPSPESPSLLPAYTSEKQVADRANEIMKDSILKNESQKLVQLVNAIANKEGEIKLPGVQLSGIIGIISWQGYMQREDSLARKYAKIIFNGEEILGPKNIYYPVAYSGQPVGEYLSWVYLQNLLPNTTYNYQLVWSEHGRKDTVITKTFITPGN